MGARAKVEELNDKTPPWREQDHDNQAICSPGGGCTCNFIVSVIPG